MKNEKMLEFVNDFSLSFWQSETRVARFEFEIYAKSAKKQARWLQSWKVSQNRNICAWRQCSYTVHVQNFLLRMTSLALCTTHANYLYLSVISVGQLNIASRDGLIRKWCIITQPVRLKKKLLKGKQKFEKSHKRRNRQIWLEKPMWHPFWDK